MTGFNTGLRWVVPSMFDQGRVIMVSRLKGGVIIPPEARSILFRLVELVMLGDYTKQDTKEYLTSRYNGLRTFSVSAGCSPNRNTSRSRVQYDLTKLKAALGQDFFDITLKGGDLSRQAMAVDGLVKKARGRSLRERFLIPIPSPVGERDELDEGNRTKLIKLTNLFSTARTAQNTKLFTPDMVGYMLYLENHQAELEGENKVCFELLRDLLIGAPTSLKEEGSFDMDDLRKQADRDETEEVQVVRGRDWTIEAKAPTPAVCVDPSKLTAEELDAFFLEQLRLEEEAEAASGICMDDDEQDEAAADNEMAEAIISAREMGELWGTGY